TAACMKKITQALNMPGGPVEPTAFHGGKIRYYDFPGRTPIQFQTAMPKTPDEKAQLAPACLGRDPYKYKPVENAKYPLALISPSNNKMISSTLGEFNYPELAATLHPEDAAARAIAAGDEIRVFNDLGEVICRAEIDARMRPGVIAIP